jgi:acetyltransferase-like isoleucine patch superfamily enzyme
MLSPFHDRMGNQLTWSQAISKIFVRFGAYGEDLLLWWLRCVSEVPFHSFRRLFYSLAGVKLTGSSTVHIGARFYHPGGITIGEDTIIGDHAVLDGRAPLTIGNHVDIASEVMIYNSEHDIHAEDFAPIEAPVQIEDYVFIGPRAIILPGVRIGRGAVVGAGAVVTKSIDPGTIVGGVPAKVIGQRQLNEYKYRLGRPRLFQ